MPKTNIGYFSPHTKVVMSGTWIQKSMAIIVTKKLKAPAPMMLCEVPAKWSQMMRYVAGTEEPIYPIGCVQCKNPMNRKRSINRYTSEGRAEIHDNLRINTGLMLQLMRKSFYNTNTEYSDNRISLFSAQWGKCAVTGREFQSTEEIHCHHKAPKSKGGTDKEESPSWDELARADEIVDDQLIFDAYANTVFSNDDFVCSAGMEEVTR